jgi:hypothetical protein
VCGPYEEQRVSKIKRHGRLLSLEALRRKR